MSKTIHCHAEMQSKGNHSYSMSIEQRVSENEQNNTLSGRNAVQGNHSYSMSFECEDMNHMGYIHSHETTNNISVFDDNLCSSNSVNELAETGEIFYHDMKSAVTGQSENENQMCLDTVSLHNDTYSLNNRLDGCEVNANLSTALNQGNIMDTEENFRVSNRNDTEDLITPLICTI